MYNTDDYKYLVSSSGNVNSVYTSFGLIAAILISGEFATQWMLPHDLYWSNQAVWKSPIFSCVHHC